MQKRNVLNSPRLLELKKNRRKVFFRKTLFLAVIILIIFFGLAYLSHLDSLNITEVEIGGNRVIDTEALKTTVNQQIARKYLWLFPKTNILIYPQNAIKNELRDKFKRVKDVSLSIKDGKILAISLIEREAKYTWCGITINLEEEKCYFLDADGYIFDEAPYFSEEVYFKFYGLENYNPLGTFFSEQNFKQLISFKDTLAGMELRPIAMYVKNDGNAEVILSKGSSASVPPKIIFKMDSDFQNIAENLDAALHTEPLLSKFKNKYSSLQYIDLRFENRVYDKFQ